MGPLAELVTAAGAVARLSGAVRSHAAAGSNAAMTPRNSHVDFLGTFMISCRSLLRSG